MVVRVLRPGCFPQGLLESGSADSQIELAVGPEDDPRRGRSVGPGDRLEDLLDVGELIPLETSPIDDGGPEVFRVRFRLPERDVDESILREARMDGDIHAGRVTTLARDWARKASDGRRVEHPFANEAKRGAVLLGDQHVAIR